MNVTEALEALRQHAAGQLSHNNAGQCPGPDEGPDVRDPRCRVCQALIVLRPDGPLRDELAPDEQTMSAVERAAQGVTPPEGWSPQDWAERYGRLSLLAGAVAAANAVRLAHVPSPRHETDGTPAELLRVCNYDAALAAALMRSTWLAQRDEANRRIGAQEAMHHFGHYANGIWSIKPYPGDRAHAWRDALARGETPWRR